MTSRSIYRRFVAVTCALGAAGALGLLAPACGNPVTDSQIDALGGETPGVEEGPFHRPGQPCLLCHNDYFGAEPSFIVGGTVFADLQSFKPVENVEVVLTDSIGETRTAVTNCIGNFYITKESWNAQFPLAVEIRYPAGYNADGTPQTDADKNVVRKVKAMGSVISRDGSCATCHSLYGRSPQVAGDGSILYYNTTGWIYANAPGETEVFPDVPASCQGKPPTDASQTSTSTSAGAGGGSP
jgi:hypothetical protein